MFVFVASYLSGEGRRDSFFFLLQFYYGNHIVCYSTNNVLVLYPTVELPANVIVGIFPRGSRVASEYYCWHFPAWP